MVEGPINLTDVVKTGGPLQNVDWIAFANWAFHIVLTGSQAYVAYAAQSEPKMAAFAIALGAVQSQMNAPTSVMKNGPK